MPSVSADFDAYYKWLGIPPSEQPPHYYRILGIPLLEEDPEVIATAADRQMAHVKSFATGRYAAESQKLLNELSRARVTLLNARQKTAYDRRLQELLANAANAPRRALQESPHPSPTGPTAAMASDGQQWDLLDVDIRTTTKLSRRRHRGPSAEMVVILVGLLAVAACLYYAAALRPGGAPPVGDLPSVASHSQNLPSRLPRSQDNGQDRSSVRLAQEPKLPTESNNTNPKVPQSPPSTPIAPDEIVDPPAPHPQIAHVIDLDLTNRRQRYVLTSQPLAPVKVLSLRGCDAPYEIEPKNGLLDKTSIVTISIHGRRDVILQLDLDAKIQDKAAIVIECHVTNDAGDEIPFVLSNLDRIRRQITKQGRSAVAEVEEMQAEKYQLETWIAAPVAKPLVERGLARARVMELSLAIPELSQQVQSLRDELDVAQDLQSLAAQIHHDGGIEIEVAE